MESDRAPVRQAGMELSATDHRIDLAEPDRAMNNRQLNTTTAAQDSIDQSQIFDCLIHWRPRIQSE
jgi:hypothetical protein